jgi:hypothetical protein
MRGALGKLAVLAVAAVYIVCAWGSGLDRASATIPAATRLAPWPFRDEAYRQDAVTALATSNGRLAAVKAREWLRVDPIDYHGAALLGAGYVLQNRAAEADKAFRVAALFGWRDQLTQLYWLDASLGLGDYVRATEHLDALLRVNPDFVGRADAVSQIEQVAQGRQALATRLAESPAWSSVLLADAKTLSDAALDRRVDTLSRAGKMGAKFTCSAIGDYARQLVDRTRPRDARRLWALYCGRGTRGGVPADPRFTALLAGTDMGPFGWNRLPDGDVSLSGAGGDGAGQMLIGDNTAPSARAVLIQPLDLPPGRYRLAVQGPGLTNAALALDCGSPQRPEFNPQGVGIATISCEDPVLTLWLAPDSHNVAIRAVSVARASGQ